MTILFMSFSLLFQRLLGFSFVIVIVVSGLVLVLVIQVVSLLAWRVKRAMNNKRERTPQRHPSDENEQRDSTTRDPHVPEELPYMELNPGPLEELPPTTSDYESLKGAVTSSEYHQYRI